MVFRGFIMLKSNNTICGKLISSLKPNSEKKVELICDNCGFITQTSYANYTNCQKKNNNNGLTKCRSCATKENGKKRIGKPAHNKGKKYPNLSKENSSCWKGGQYKSFDGYTMIHVKSGHSNCGWNSYKKRHRVVIEENIGRKLSKEDVVHHIDGNKQNDDLENLYLTNSSGHKDAHYSLMLIGYELYRNKLINFENGKYVAHDKLREFLEHPEEDNQKPSLDGDIPEGSTTRDESILDNNISTSAGLPNK